MLSPTFDLAQYPTGDTIRLLASLLERMTNANDQLNKAAITRNGTTEMRRSSSASPIGACPSSTPLPKPSPSAAATTTTSSTSLINNNNRHTDNGTSYTVFHARSIPSIDIYSYLSRILKYCPCANECFLSLLVYFDRMSKNALAITGQPFTIDSFNIHRLIISGIIISSKFFSDIFYTNTRYAKVGGLPVSELNRLELEFLQLNEFNISVSISELQRYGDQLLKVGLKEQEMRMLRESSPSSYTVRHGRSTSLGSTALVRTLDGIENYKQQQHQRKSTDQPSVQQLVDGTNKLYLDDHHYLQHDSKNGGNTMENVKRHSASCIGKQQHAPHYHQYHPHQQGNKEMYMYAPYTSPLAPPSSSSSSHISAQAMPANGHPAMRRMGSMGSLHSLYQSPLAVATTNEESLTYQQQQQHHQHQHQQPMTPLSITTPPFFHRPQSRHDSHQHPRNDENQQYRYQQRHSFADWPLVTTSSSSSYAMYSGSPPKTRQRHESMGLNGNPKSNGWRLPRQTKSSINLYQQHNSIWANNTPTSSMTTSTIPIDPAHQYQYQQQQIHGVVPQQQPAYHLPNSGNRRRLSLTSVHAPAFIPQRPASAEYTTTHGNGTAPPVATTSTTSGSFAYYPVTSSASYQYPIGIPTPPPSSSPTHQQHYQYHQHHQQYQNQQLKSDLAYPYSISSSSSSTSSSHQLYL